MKTITKLLLVGCLILTFTSCNIYKPLTQSKADNNETYSVDYLFEHEGCKVYRFMDEGRYVYFTNCTGNVSVATSDSTNYTIQNVINVDR
ncbi:DUF4884 domain-containing protein [Bacteroidales bacterium OttesenSCG-928-J19]|nr:DUF4884 domain-containing protein [Bacteroidales bacterium OttesenSCG-928-J19]